LLLTSVTHTKLLNNLISDGATDNVTSEAAMFTEIVEPLLSPPKILRNSGKVKEIW
jgi:hypothetical protein